MSAPLPEHLNAFRCPKCGNDGEAGPLRFLEDITSYRPIVGVKRGALEIDGLYRTDGYDDGTNMRFECRGRITTADGSRSECGHEWPVPPWLYDRIDWI
ncbi:MAG: hypothetical protein WCK01_00500 [Candidatus Uhrbacteria bacterium]